MKPPHIVFHHAGRWSLGAAGVAVVLVAGIIGATGGVVGAAAHDQTATAPAGRLVMTAAAAPVPLAPFRATGLPAGPATGVPLHLLLPAGYTLKHTHGGPTYVYVISGTLTISDAAGTKTYSSGSFFAEPPGHVHTVHTAKSVDIFVLSLLPPGADATIPVK